jgi:hypothetical protein
MIRDSLVAMLGLGYSILVMYATCSEAIAMGYILLMLGYLYLGWRHQRDRIALRTEPYELPELPNEAPATLAGCPGKD